MYKHILFATDFSPEAQIAESRALELAKLNKARFSLIHVIDYYPSMSLEGGMAISPNIDDMMTRNAQEQLAECQSRLMLKPAHAHLSHGAPKHAITEFAAEIGADLIVLGSHGRHGLGLLLGSTANGVLHIAKCDVLAVRIN